MTTFTYATMFTGGDGWGQGFQQVGGQGAWGIEWNSEIADVARQNGSPNVIEADARGVAYSDLIIPDVLAVSPDCTRASNANSHGGETEEDLTRADAVNRALRTFAERGTLPRIFLLENVWPYGKFESFHRIVTTLERLGYWWVYDHVNCADFGVPQTRRRLIVRAVHGGWVPHLPLPVPWVGWYSAIEDLLDTLPADQFAPWQLSRLPLALQDHALFSNQESDDSAHELTYRQGGQPAITVRAGLTAANYKAFLLGGQESGAAGQEERGAVCRLDTDPALTVTAGASSKHPLRALLVGGGNTNKTVVDSRPRQDDQPAFTVTGASDRDRAFLVPGSNAGQEWGKGYRAAEEPAHTISATVGRHQDRAWLTTGRVVRMTPRALARFQTFPDTYRLPITAKLAGRVTGNAVPPLLARRLIEGLVEGVGL